MIFYFSFFSIQWYRCTSISLHFHKQKTYSFWVYNLSYLYRTLLIFYTNIFNDLPHSLNLILSILKTGLNSMKCVNISKIFLCSIINKTTLKINIYNRYSVTRFVWLKFLIWVSSQFHFRFWKHNIWINSELKLMENYALHIKKCIFNLLKRIIGIGTGTFDNH